MDFYTDFIKDHKPKYVTTENIQREYIVGGISDTAFLILLYI
ncbi:MAG: hypothetical protein WCJ58_03100 [bacterium]